MSLKQTIFVKIIFITVHCAVHAIKLIKFDMAKLVFKFYHQMDFNIIFTNEFYIGSFFSFQRQDISLCKK